MSTDTTHEKILVIEVDHYSMCDDGPDKQDGQWTIHSFSSRHTNFAEPESVGLSMDLDEKRFPVITDKALKKKFEKGLAFFLTYHEHGNCEWSLNRGAGVPTGVMFDTVNVAGLLVWNHPASDMGAKTVEERAKDAAAFLRVYTDWCNGETYEYAIKGYSKCGECGHDKDEEDLEASCGFIGSDDLVSAINEAVSGLDDEWKDAKIRIRDKYGILSYAKLNFEDRIVGKKFHG